MIEPNFKKYFAKSEEPASTTGLQTNAIALRMITTNQTTIRTLRQNSTPPDAPLRLVALPATTNR